MAASGSAATGDDRYSFARRAERLNSRTHPLVRQAGPEIFGDPDVRFTDLGTVIIDATSRMRTSMQGR